MANVSEEPGARTGHRGFRGSRRIQARLVNRGHDTQVTLRDGSIIVLKGIIEAAAFFSPIPRHPRSRR